jgi:hypothetical protein
MAKGENSPCFEFIHKTLGEDLIGVEIGIWDGGNAEAVLHYIKPRLYFMIDPYVEHNGSKIKQHEYDAMFLKTFEKFRHYPNAIIIRKTSYDSLSCILNNLDFVYIDGAHDYDNKILDLRSWYPKIRSGGILCGDDYIIPSVIKAVNDFSLESGISFDISKNSNPHPPEYWAIKK